MGATRTVSAGTTYAAIGLYDADGNFLVGGSRTAPANGDADGNPFSRFYGVKSGTPPANEPETTQITGDDGLRGEIEFPSIETRRFTLEVGDQDLDLVAKITGAEIRDVAGGRGIAVDADDVPDRDAVILLQSRSVDTITGKSGYTVTMIPRATVSYLGRSEATEREAAAYQFSVTPQLSQYEPWGITMTIALNGKTQTRSFSYSFVKPVWMQVWTGDGATTDFTTQHDLVGASAIEVFVDKVNVAVDSVSGNTFTLASAPAAGRPIVALYQFDAFND